MEYKIYNSPYERGKNVVEGIDKIDVKTLCSNCEKNDFRWVNGFGECYSGNFKKCKIRNGEFVTEEEKNNNKKYHDIFRSIKLDRKINLFKKEDLEIINYFIESLCLSVYKIETNENDLIVLFN